MLAEWSGGDLPLSGRDVGLWERAEQAIIPIAAAT